MFALVALGNARIVVGERVASDVDVIPFVVQVMLLYVHPFFP